MKNYDLIKLLKFIDGNHSFRKNKGKKVKYVDSTVDMRTGDIFSITLRGMFETQNFTLVNENKNKNLFEWIVDWLEDQDE